MKNRDYQDKVVLVTGAASGIGKAAAVAFANSGAMLVLADTQADAGGRVANLIENLGCKVTFIKCDVSQDNDVKNLVNRAVETFGRLDCAFNNAGIEGDQGAIVDCTEENWDHVISVNLKSVWLCLKYEIQQMLKQGGGAIVNCSSVAGLTGFQGLPAYVASKHGVVGLTKAAALEYAKANIRINVICPGVIQTPMIDRIIHGDEASKQNLEAGEPIGRFGQPEEIAQAALWLCSGAASFVVGHPLVVDGGWLAQ